MEIVIEIGDPEQGLIYSIMALGLYQLPCSGFPDLSVDGTFRWEHITAILILRERVNPWLACLLSFWPADSPACSPVTARQAEDNGPPSGIFNDDRPPSVNLAIADTSYSPPTEPHYF